MPGSLIVLSAGDWETIELLESASGATDVRGVPIDAVARRLWGVPVALNQGLGAKVGLVIGKDAVTVDHDGVVDVRWSDAVNDDFTKNFVRCRVEGRFGVSVNQPGAVVKVATATLSLQPWDADRHRPSCCCSRASAPDVTAGAVSSPHRPISPARHPKTPDWLSDAARAEWDRITPGLEALDLIKPEDRAALTVYVETWSTYCEAVALLRAEGLTLVNPDSGHTSAHPCAQIAHNAGLLLLRYAGEFGLTPVAERRLGTITGTDDEHDPFNGG